MRLDQLKLFLKVAENGSISAAARAANIAQPALSVQISNLETDLGLKLLQRSVKGVVLTEAGERLRLRADAILRHVAQAREEVRATDGHPSGQITIALARSMVPILSGLAFWRARELFPAINLQILDLAANIISTQINTRQIDLALLPNALAMSEITYEPVIAQSLYLVGPPLKNVKPRQTKPSTIEFSGLHRFPLVMGGRENQLRAELEMTAIREGHALNIAYVQDEANVYLEIVRSGPAHTVVPYSTFAHDIESGALTAHLIVNPSIERVLSFAWKEGTELSMAGRVIKTLLTELIGDLVRSGALRGKLLTTPQDVCLNSE